MLGEHSRRKKQRSNDQIISVIQRLDATKVADSVSAVKLAGFMRGTLTAANTYPVLKSTAFRGLIKEMFLAVVTDYSEEHKSQVAESMGFVITRSLDSVASDADVEFFAENVVDSIRDACVKIVDEVRDVSPESLSALQQTAMLKRLTMLLENIDKHHEALHKSSSQASMKARESWLGTYRALCERSHGYIVPPDFDTNRKISMNDLYVMPTISMGETKDYRGGNPLEFEEFRNSIDRTVLLGDPGGGKSTLSNYLTTSWAKSDEGIVPFHITLREYAKQPHELSVLQYIEQQMSAYYQHQPPEGLVEELLLSGEAAVIFDGLDELIDTSKRRSISNTVELFGIRYPLAKILVTSRRVGYDQARLDPEIHKVCVISEFMDADVASYVHKWFSCQEDYTDAESQKLAGAFIEQSNLVPDLRSNPLMLALMCIIFRGENFIPRNRPAVYEKCANLLFEKWDGHRAIEVPLDAKSHVDAALKYVAHWMLVSGSGDLGVRHDDLVRVIAKYLNGRAFDTEEESERAATQFVDFCKGRAWVLSDAGTTAEGDSLFTFTHRTFMEYFAAFHLTRINDTPEKLARTLLKKVARQEWDVVAQLAVQIVDRGVDRGSERALRTMLDEKRRRSDEGKSNVLDFIARCSVFATLSPSFVRDLSTSCISALLDQLEGSDKGAPIFAIRPWLTLLSRSGEAHRESIVDVHKKTLTEALSSSESEKWKAAGRFVILGVNVSWQNSFERGMRWSVLYSTFEGLAISASKRLKELCVEEPSNHVALVMANIETPSEAVQVLKNEGKSFAEIFFYDKAEIRRISTPTYSFMLSSLAGASIDSIEGSSAKQAGELAEVFLYEFWQSQKRHDLTNLRRLRLNPFRFRDIVDIKSTNSPKICEAGLIVGLGNAEIMSNFLGREFFIGTSNLIGELVTAKEEGGTIDQNALAGYKFSEEVVEFVIGWVGGTRKVFYPRESKVASSR